MKIYTKTGDDGTTGLFGGGRVPKDHPRVAAYGAVDELNCHIGWVRSMRVPADVDEALGRIQDELFTLGADLATPADAKAASKVRRVVSEDADWLEQSIDRFDAEIPPLRTFVLPGGAPAAAAVHLARAVCRRAERASVTLAREEPVGPATVIYLNRLSDFLFTLGRVLNHRASVPETPWVARPPDSAS
jgi:cob(I)alamin adenosyltransferase